MSEWSERRCVGRMSPLAVASERCSACAGYGWHRGGLFECVVRAVYRSVREWLRETECVESHVVRTRSGYVLEPALTRAAVSDVVSRMPMRRAVYTLARHGLWPVSERWT